MRLTPIVTFALIVFFMGLTLLRQYELREDMVATPNSALPPLSLNTLDGNQKWGEKTVLGHVSVVNIFASWCGPCAKEMPELVALKKQFSSVQFEGLVWNDDPALIAAFLKQHGNPFDRLWLDRTGDAAIALGIRGIPETFIIDAKGVVRLRLTGAITKNMRTEKLTDTLISLSDEAKKK